MVEQTIGINSTNSVLVLHNICKEICLYIAGVYICMYICKHYSGSSLYRGILMHVGAYGNI